MATRTQPLAPHYMWADDNNTVFITMQVTNAVKSSVKVNLTHEGNLSFCVSTSTSSIKASKSNTYVKHCVNYVNFFQSSCYALQLSLFAAVRPEVIVLTVSLLTAPQDYIVDVNDRYYPTTA